MTPPFLFMIKEILKSLWSIEKLFVSLIPSMFLTCKKYLFSINDYDQQENNILIKNYIYGLFV